MHSPSLTKVANRYRTVLASLTTNLREARFEHCVSGTEKEYEIEARLVTCMQRLAHNIGGLRSAATTQFNLLAQSDASTLSLLSTANKYRDDDHHDDGDNGSLLASYSDAISSAFGNTLAPIDEVSEEGTEQGEQPSEEPDSRSQISSDQATPLAIEVFAQFIKYLGPSMVLWLVRTLCQILSFLAESVHLCPETDARRPPIRSWTRISDCAERTIQEQFGRCH